MSGSSVLKVSWNPATLPLTKQAIMADSVDMVLRAICEWSLGATRFALEVRIGIAVGLLVEDGNSAINGMELQRRETRWAFVFRQRVNLVHVECSVESRLGVHG
jgi:hypothetical protein